jgi:hypothetical protein
MSLKSAYFRFRGHHAATPIDRNTLQTSAARARVLGVATPPESFHSLRFWRDLLVEERNRAARSLDPAVQAELHHHVEALYSRWTVHMRYQAPVTSMVDVELAAGAAEWIDRNHRTLYT